MFCHLPGKAQGSHFFRAGRTSRHDTKVVEIQVDGVAFLHQHPGGDRAKLFAGPIGVHRAGPGLDLEESQRFFFFERSKRRVLIAGGNDRLHKGGA